MKLAIVGVVFLTAIGVLVYMGVVEAGIPMVKIKDLLATEWKGDHQPQTCQIDEVKIASIEHQPSPLEFTISSASEPGVLLKVKSRRNPPDLFEVGKGVHLKGVYDPKTKTFIAEEVVTNCPSKYEASKSAGLPPASPSSAPPPPPEKAN